jgi:hypothetical protein
MMRRVGVGVLGLALVAGALVGCTSHPAGNAVAPGSYKLVAFDTCADALAGLRAAASSAVGPYGFLGNTFAVDGLEHGALPVPQAANAAGSSADRSVAGPSGSDPSYSDTNSYEAGADEPDLVKTDGHRIVTVSGGVLRVVDAASRRLMSTVDLVEPGQSDQQTRYTPGELLLSGDHALVLLREAVLVRTPANPLAPASFVAPSTVVRLILVDLSGGAHVLSRVDADGSLLDARQTGATVRVVVQSGPRIAFPGSPTGNDADRTAANRTVIAGTGIDAWLPHITTTTGGRTTTTDVGCDAISRPATYSGTSLLTVLSFDLSAAGLGDGQPVVLVADGDTVYSTGATLYVTSDQRWQATRIVPVPAPAAGTAVAPGGAVAPPGAVASGGAIAPDGAVTKPGAAVTKGTPTLPHTEIYQFDTTGAKPVFVAGGTVPGYLINQYALSEWHGDLRAASTSDLPGGRQSGVYVLGRSGDRLSVKGSVEGLGRGEQIYAVRFVGAVGYVVTFKQTDPLYTVDLSDPAKPAVRGELKIPGYSAYLHPADGSHLIGVGRDAGGRGTVNGIQVSLFDVANLAAPARLANFAVPGAYSEAEFDPHAFLYWPATGLLVVPLQRSTPISGGPVPVDDQTKTASGSGGGSGASTGSGGAVGSTGSTGSAGTNTPGSVAAAPDVAVSPALAPISGALVLQLTGNSIRQVGFVSQPGPNYQPQIRRTVLIGQTLWTVSDAGLMASDANTLARQAWLPYA